MNKMEENLKSAIFTQSQHLHNQKLDKINKQKFPTEHQKMSPATNPNVISSGETTDRWSRLQYNRWLVLSMASLNVLVNGSLSYNAGVLHIAIMQHYNPDPLLAAWLVSLYLSLCYLAAPIASLVINVYNCRVCVFTSGILTLVGFSSTVLAYRVELLFLSFTLVGIGNSMSMTAGSIIVSCYFPDNTALAIGIFVSSSGLGSFIHPPLTQFLLDNFGFHSSLLILGAIGSHSCFAALFLQQNKHEQDLKFSAQNSDTQVTRTVLKYLQLFTRTNFDFFLMSNFFFRLGECAFIIYLPEYLVVKMGYTKLDAAAASSLKGISGFVSRLLAGIIATDNNIGPEMIFLGLNVLSLLTLALYSVILQIHSGAYILCVCFGLYCGGLVPMVVPIVLTLLKKEETPFGIGLAYKCQGLGMLVGPVISTVAKNSLGHDSVLTTSLVGFLLSVICYVLSIISKK